MKPAGALLLIITLGSFVSASGQNSQSSSVFPHLLPVTEVPATANAMAIDARKTDPPAAVDVPTRRRLFGSEAISKGMVWHPRRDLWLQSEINSCEFCAPPMTWRHAAFDKKALPLWLSAVGMGVLDTEYTLSRPCMKTHACSEGNPLLGSTRAQQYGVRMPVLAGAWLLTSWLRKGDDKRNIGGMRHWYFLAIGHIAAPTIAFSINAARAR